VPIQRPQPYGGFNFLVVVQGLNPTGKEVGGTFTEVSGLTATVGMIKYRSGADLLWFTKLPGITQHDDLVLKYGTTGSVLFWNWILEAMSGRVRRLNGQIRLLDESRRKVVQWNITDAWPTKYTGPSMNAANDEFSVEEVQLAYHTLEIV
jgi:phage tail-like protein